VDPLHGRMLWTSNTFHLRTHLHSLRWMLRVREASYVSLTSPGCGGPSSRARKCLQAGLDARVGVETVAVETLRWPDGRRERGGMAEACDRTACRCWWRGLMSRALSCIRYDPFSAS
jgi:hypothetical protein